jgi:bifunctional ADP-heptose synthase (sugar kinase/adenylyltransferase)
MSKILVIGESCRDVFVYCNADRLCPDVPVPVLNVIDQTENPGMAKNVQRNIKSLMGECDLITNFNWYNITKTRYVHKKSNHTFIRVDSPHDIGNIKLEEINLDYDIVVISDYNKGFLKESDIEYICSKHDCVFLDTKKILGTWAEKAKFIKINDYEYNNSKNFLNENLSSKIIHTDGANGANYKSVNYPVKRVEVKDSSGAGDAFMSALVSEYHKTKDIIKSIKFANKCASKVVTEVGVTTI